MLIHHNRQRRNYQLGTTETMQGHNPWSRTTFSTTFLVVLEECYDRQCQKLQISREEQAATSDRHQRRLEDPTTLVEQQFRYNDVDDRRTDVQEGGCDDLDDPWPCRARDVPEALRRQRLEIGL